MSQKQMTRSQWERHYADPQHFDQIFRDLNSLREQELRFGLSTAQQTQLSVIEAAINAKFGH